MNDESKLKEQATNYLTMLHINRVRQLLNLAVTEFIQRGEDHDQSKLVSPEVELFAEYTDKLAGCTYGSPEYQEFKRLLKPALDHHYANNRHHPEYYANGVNDMTLFDVLEMLMDWKAASERQNNGCINRSVEENSERFGIHKQLTQILVNTIKYVEAIE